MHAARDRSHFLRKRERERRRTKCSSGSPRKSLNVGKVGVKGRLGLRVRSRVMVRVCTSPELTNDGWTEQKMEGGGVGLGVGGSLLPGF